ncbi:MAG: ATP-binding protein, partial [Pseudomonadota bacterium]
LQNAIDALSHSPSPLITVTSGHSDNSASICIHDNGSGIEPKLMNKVFSPYVTTKQVGKGLGLGLSITYEIIQEYNGSIEVSSDAKGTQFKIVFPLMDRHQSSMQAHDSQQITQQNNTATV